MITHELCVVVILFFVNVSISFPVMRLPRAVDDAAGCSPTANPLSVRTSNLEDKVFELDDDQRLRVQVYLEKNGYLPLQFSSIPGYRVSEDNLRHAVSMFQRFVRLPETGILDEETFNLTVANRCGVPDIVYGLPDGTYTSWARWQKADLTYRIVGHPGTLGEGAIHGLVMSAMEMWMEVTPLSLCEEFDDAADVDINIRHVQGEHGDGLTLDGPGGTLAHAFLPSSGEIHLDMDEHWTTGQRGDSNGTDYLQVIAHEIGHALGLLHSGVEGSIMFPIYMYKQNITLCRTDVESIQSLYGNAVSSEDVQQRCPERTTTTKTLTSTSTPNSLKETITTTIRTLSSSSSSTIGLS